LCFTRVASNVRKLAFAHLQQLGCTPVFIIVTPVNIVMIVISVPIDIIVTCITIVVVVARITIVVVISVTMVCHRRQMLSVSPFSNVSFK
jgi:hypothetical protein